MEEQTDDPDDAVVRLERALERIARVATRSTPAPPPITPTEEATIAPLEEIASRLDQLIDRLRAATANKAG
jgi:hypothetical protein